MISVAILLIVTGMQFFGQYIYAGFNFAFYIDDPYIHLSIAKNLVEHGSWGPIAGEFHSSSSSPIFTLLVSLFYFLGIGGLYVPVLINVIAGIVSLYVVKKIAEEQSLSASSLLIISISLIMIIPLYYIIFVSMEHVLHFALILYLIYKASKILSEKTYNLSEIITFSILTGITCLVRYENLFFVAVIGVILLYRKKIKIAFLFGIIAVIPVIIYGLISVMNGEFLLPNSVLVKGVRSTGSVFEYLKYIVRPLKYLATTPETGLLFLSTGVLAFYKYRKKQFDTAFYFSLITASLIYIHPAFAKFGWYGRYEAYLIGLGCVSFFWIIPILKENKDLKYLPYILLGFLILYRGLYEPMKYRYGMKNIYEQQVQMGKFVGQYYNDSVIAVNDIGAVSYYSNAKLLDLWALASTELAEYVIENDKIDKQIVDKVAEKKEVEIAITYGKGFIGHIPDHWEKVATWKIEKRQTPAHNTVYFHVVTQNKDTLRKQIEEYSKTKLPKDVEVQYYPDNNN